MPTAAKLKSRLRTATLALRDALSAAERIEYSLQAAGHGLSVPSLTGDRLPADTVISGFLPIRSEIDARPLLADLAKLGARLCLPVVVSKSRLEFRELVREAPLVQSGFGTIGPDEGAKVLEPQIMIVPLSVFDGRGGRIGYGGGYYDRSIAELAGKGKKPELIGMGFSIQKADLVPMEPHDHYLDGIITETGYFDF